MVLSQKRKTIVPVLVKVLIKATYQNISKPLSPFFSRLFKKWSTLFFIIQQVFICITTSLGSFQKHLFVEQYFYLFHLCLHRHTHGKFHPLSKTKQQKVFKRRRPKRDKMLTRDDRDAGAFMQESQHSF